MSGLRIGIPSSDALDHATRQVVDPMKEIMETREGLRGDRHQRAITFQDLIDLGLKTETEVDEYLATL